MAATTFLPSFVSYSSLIECNITISQSRYSTLSTSVGKSSPTSSLPILLISKEVSCKPVSKYFDVSLSSIISTVLPNFFAILFNLPKESPPIPVEMMKTLSSFSCLFLSYNEYRLTPRCMANFSFAI